MKVRFNSVVKMLGLAAALACAGGASAQSAGQITAKFGANRLTPKVVSGDISAPALPGSKADVSSNTQPVLIFAYGITDNISAEMALGTPYKHKIYGDGAIKGVGELGSVKALPPTTFLQYRFFKPDALIRPFVGAGITYAHFLKETGSAKMTALTNPGGPPTTFQLDNKWTYTLQAGVAVNFTERWFADVTFMKTKLSTTARFTTGQTQHMKLDPEAVIVAVGYKF
jgi:outer membrane protein